MPTTTVTGPVITRRAALAVGLGTALAAPAIRPSFAQGAPIRVGVLAGAGLLGERVGPLFGLAVALVAAGLWLVNRPGAGAARAA